MGKVKWIMFKTEMFDDEKIKIIQAMPEGDALIVVWIRMLLLAGISNADGYLMISDNLPYTEDMLATIFNKPLSIIRLAIKTFETFGMIEADKEGIFIRDFSESQSGKMQELREYNRIKQAESRKRAREKLLSMQPECQTDVIDTSLTSQTDVNANVIDKGAECQPKDIDIDKDIYININNKPQNPVDFGDKTERLDYKRIADTYNAICKDLPKVCILTDKRRRKIRELINALNKSKVLMELDAYGRMEHIFRLADESDFLSGRTQTNSWCGFDWLINFKNALKVIEGNYKNGGAKRVEPQPRNTDHSIESESDALAAFRANRERDT